MTGNGHREGLAETRRIEGRLPLESVSEVIVGHIVEVDPERGRIRVRDERTSSSVWFGLSKARFGNRVDLDGGSGRTIADLDPGDRVQVRGDRTRSGSLRARALKLIGCREPLACFG